MRAIRASAGVVATIIAIPLFGETLIDRRERYGSGSAELARWIEAQLAVFDQCSGEVAFEPPKARPRLATLGTA